jgi:hypothetical protein
LTPLGRKRHAGAAEDIVWIRELRQRGDSHAVHVNFLWKHDELPLYLTDNHRAALWCWRKHVLRSKPYGLVHLDAHWDATPMNPEEFALLEESWPVLDDFEVFDKLHLPGARRSLLTDAPSPIVQYDNYIDPFLKLYPWLSEAHVAARQLRREKLDGALADAVKRRQAHVYTVGSLSDRIDSILDHARAPMIVNVDLDYVFTLERRKRCVSDDRVRSFFRALAHRWDKTRVMTIALSPECCGGWAASETVAKVAFEALGVSWPLPAEDETA